MIFCSKFGNDFPNIAIEALMMDRINNNTLLRNSVTKDMSASQIPGVFQYYLPETKFENNYGCKWS